MTKEEPSHWRVLSERLHADCRIYRIYEQECMHPVDGRKGAFYVMRCTDWVQVLPITEEGDIILVNQYRFSSGELSWEVPGGVMDATDESPEATAARELVEETGFVGEPGEVIASNYPNPALQANKVHFVLIKNCKKVAGQNLDPNEELEVKTVSIKTAMQMLSDGEITHGIAINSLFYLSSYLANE